MSVTVNVNDLSISHKGSNGFSIATVPDVCKTPTPGGPVPMPYPNIARSGDLADGTTTVKADDGRVVFTHSDERNSDELHGTPGAYGYSARVPMVGWSPGLYVLSIDAKSRVGNAQPVSRVIQFKVVGP